MSGIERWLPAILCAAMLLGETASLPHTREGATRADRGSYYLFRGGMVAGFLAALAGWWAGALPEALALGRWAAGAGVGLVGAGIALRVWSMRTLGDYFTRVVQVSPDQKVVERGPYRLLRHPSYSGVALSALGVALSTRNGAALALIGVPFAVGVTYRMHVEERALMASLGDPYREYMRRTKRLIPYVF